jgi:hypothetical protein
MLEKLRPSLAERLQQPLQVCPTPVTHIFIFSPPQICKYGAFLYNFILLLNMMEVLDILRIFIQKISFSLSQRFWSES